MKGTENENFIFTLPENTTLCPLTKANVYTFKTMYITHTDLSQSFSKKIQTI